MAERNCYAPGSLYKFNQRFPAADMAQIFDECKAAARRQHHRFGQHFLIRYGKPGEVWPKLFNETDTAKAELMITAHIRQYGAWR